MITGGALPEDFYGKIPRACPACGGQADFPVWSAQLGKYLCFTCNERRAATALQG